jgi:hypothetical protein
MMHPASIVESIRVLFARFVWVASPVIARAAK